MPLAVNVFHYDFDWGYTYSNVIKSKKFYNIGHWPNTQTYDHVGTNTQAYH